MTILIAGGTGLIGRKLETTLSEKGHRVFILSRNPRKENQHKWNPGQNEIDFPFFDQINVLINLSGEGIADKRWSAKRKKELYDSRIGTNVFLHSLVGRMPNLKQFISSSGINCYGYTNPEKVYQENDPFGKDYLSQLVKSWEESADLFVPKAKVAKIRTAVVLDKSGGALQKMSAAIKLGIGSPLGTGKQMMPWIHSEDLVDLFVHVIEHELQGAFNAVSHNHSNKDFMKAIAKTLGKPFFFPNVPSFAMKLLFGEMSSVLLDGLNASNDKIIKSGFNFRFKTLDAALQDLLN
jgi:uncharacterized protein